MKIKTLMVSLIFISTAFIIMSNISMRVGSQTILADDTAILKGAPVPDDYEFDVLDTSHAVVGVRPLAGDDFDLEVYEDTTYTTLIESSTSVGDAVDFVVLDKTVWAGSSRGAKVTSGTASYVIEMENDVEEHSFPDTWSGAMDAISGNPVVDLGLPGSWEWNHVCHPTVLYDGTTYHMWYAGNDGVNYRIGYANSSDGITWIKHPSNPVVDIGSPGSWEDRWVHTPTVLYDGATYHMWYGGLDVANFRFQIGYANSSDGIIWTKSGANPVLDVGSSGSWDDSDVTGPMVLYDGITYHMWYAGMDGMNYRIGYANSSDGISWTKSGANPVLDLGTSGSWDDFWMHSPTIQYNGTEFHMWYYGGDGSVYRIGYATSSDGITWVKSGVNPVVDVGSSGSWDDSRILGPTVFYDGATYHMWYAGSDGANYRIGYATSLDMINWTKFQYGEVLDAFEITNITADLPYTINLNVPSTADLDLFIFNTTGGRDDAFASSINTGAGVDESIIFSAPITGDYLLVITNEDSGTGTYTVMVTIQGPKDLKQEAIHELESFEYQSGKCKGVTSLTLEYSGGAGVDISVDKGLVTDNGDGTYTITPVAGDSKLSSNTEIYVDGELNLKLHTSCSRPLDVDDVYGDFTVVALDKIKARPKEVQKAIDHIKKSLNINTKNPSKPWKKHDLWLDETHLDPKYGKFVFYEEKKAVKYLMKASKCKGITSLTMENTGQGAMIEVTKGGTFGPQWVDSGEEFIILPEEGKTKLGSNTVLLVDVDEVKIHTSCSKPLDVGDVNDDLVVNALDKIYKSGWSAALEELSKDVIDKLVEVDKMLAEIALEEALNTSVQNPKHQYKYNKMIEKAQEELLKAEEDWCKGRPDKAIDHYKKGWQHSQKAIKEAMKK